MRMTIGSARLGGGSGRDPAGRTGRVRRGGARECRDMIGSDKECHEYVRLERIQLVTAAVLELLCGSALLHLFCALLKFPFHLWRDDRCDSFDSVNAFSVMLLTHPFSNDNASSHSSSSVLSLSGSTAKNFMYAAQNPRRCATLKSTT